MEGELVYKQIVEKLMYRFQHRLTTWCDIKRIGLFFWNKLNETYKNKWEKRHEGEEAFWYFAQHLSYYIRSDYTIMILFLYNNLSSNGRRYFETFKENYLDILVFKLLP